MLAGNTNPQQAAAALLALVEEEAAGLWPFSGRMELDGDVLVVRSLMDSRGVQMNGHVYQLVPSQKPHISRPDALRCIEAWITLEQAAAVLAVREMVEVRS